LRVFEDDDAVPLRPGEAGETAEFVAVVDRLADPYPALVVDVHAGGVDEQRLTGPQRKGQPLADLERLRGPLRRQLGMADGGGEQDQAGQEMTQPAVHDGGRLQEARATDAGGCMSIS